MNIDIKGAFLESASSRIGKDFLGGLSFKETIVFKYGNIRVTVEVEGQNKPIDDKKYRGESFDIEIKQNKL